MSNEWLILFFLVGAIFVGLVLIFSGIVAPKSSMPMLDADALKQTLKPQDDFDDITELENNTSTPSGKRKAGRPKKIRD